MGFESFWRTARRVAGSRPRISFSMAWREAMRAIISSQIGEGVSWPNLTKRRRQWVQQCASAQGFAVSSGSASPS